MWGSGDASSIERAQLARSLTGALRCPRAVGGLPRTVFSQPHDPCFRPRPTARIASRRPLEPQRRPRKAGPQSGSGRPGTSLRSSALPSLLSVAADHHVRDRGARCACESRDAGISSTAESRASVAYDRRVVAEGREGRTLLRGCITCRCDRAPIETFAVVGVGVGRMVSLKTIRAVCPFASAVDTKTTNGHVGVGTDTRERLEFGIVTDEIDPGVIDKRGSWGKSNGAPARRPLNIHRPARVEYRRGRNS
jgi:hypothetical protein